jgi:hypothetical protein
MADSMQSFTVAWITALPHELAACRAMFDEIYKNSPKDFVKHNGDDKTYSWGRVEKHFVVVVCLPAGGYGTISAAVVAQALRSSLPHIRIGMMIGIGAGIPGEALKDDSTFCVQHEIKLGDVVISEPSGTSGGVVQLDLMKMREADDLTHAFRMGSLNSPPFAMRTALTSMKADHEQGET